MFKFIESFPCSHFVNLTEDKRNSAERGGKIIMPLWVLDELNNMDIVYPLMFKLTNKRSNRVTHTGVLEFFDEGETIYLPSWLMKNLEVEEGEMVTVENTSLPIATYSRFQPLSASFLDISNPKAVLENYLRQFTCLTTGDVLSISYNDKIYELKVLETRPSFAVNIIECDMFVDFVAPEGFQEKQVEPKEETEIGMKSSFEFEPFTGKGCRLDGKPQKRKYEDEVKIEAKSKKSKLSRGIPDYEFEVGSLNFMRNAEAPPKTVESHGFVPFKEEGFSMLTPAISNDTDSD